MRHPIFMGDVMDIVFPSMKIKGKLYFEIPHSWNNVD